MLKQLRQVTKPGFQTTGRIFGRTLGAALAASLLITAAASAQPIIFDNVPAGFPLGGGGAVIRGTDADPPLASISLAQQFTLAENATFGFVQLGLTGPEAGALIDIALYSGSGSGPDTLIESLGTVDETQMPSDLTGFDAGAVIMTSASKPLLQAGVEYYIVATPATSTSHAAWATVGYTFGHWNDVGGAGWQYQGGGHTQLSTRVFAAVEPMIVGSPDLPYGINNLPIVHSGGIGLFDVRFDERSFDSAFGTGAPVLTFTTEADVEAALKTVGAFLQDSAIYTLSSTPTYSGTFNNDLVSALTFDSSDVMTWAHIGFSGPAGWYYHGVWSPTLARSQSLESFDPDYAWATFTPVASATSIFAKTITVTHPGNTGDDPHAGYGGVDYLYDIGQFEITAGQYAAFLNAVAADDTYGLYNTDMWDEDTGCKIERTGGPTVYSYSVAIDWRDLPVNFISWGDAARFCNWLHNGQPTGLQDLTTTEDGSYYLNGATSDAELIAIAREPNATWIIPSEDEWYKAAYHHNDGATANYWDYPTGSDTAPTSEPPPGFDMTFGSANYYGADFAVGAPYFRTDVGSYDAKPSASPYGTFDQGGNVSEWTEEIIFGTSRVTRGGAFYSSASDIRSWSQAGFSPTLEFDGFGFRVARTRNEVSPCAPTPERLGGFHVSGYTKNVAVEGSLACLARGTYGLAFLDVSDPTAPAHLSSPDMATDAFDVVLDGTLAYVTDWNEGLLIVDASTPTSPALVGSYSFGGPTYGLTVQGATAYVAALANGLQIIDVSDPNTPTYLGSYVGSGFATDVAVVGNTAYVTSFDGGLQIIDVSDPNDTSLLGEYDTPGISVGLTVNGDVAYVADGEAGLQMIDVSDPSAPWLLAAFDTPNTAFSVVIKDDTAYVTDGDGGLLLVDVSNPAAPALSSWYGTPGTAGGVFVDGSTLYLAAGDFGLQILDLVDPVLTVSYLGSYDTPDQAIGVTVLADIAYVGDDSTLEIVDVSDPTMPAFLGSYATPGNAGVVAVSGTTAYVADEESGLQIVDVSDPTDPAFITSYGGTDVVDVVVAGAVAYVADGPRMRTLDVSDPATPTPLGSLLVSGDSVRAITLAGKTAYLAAGSAGLQICDVSDPNSPDLLGTSDAPDNAVDVAVVGTTAYVVNTDDALRLDIIDVADPNAPALLGTLDLPTWAWGVTAVGSTVYVAGTYSGLLVIDASDPTSPFLLDSYDTSGFAKAVAVVGTTAYLAAGNAGLEIVHVADPCSVGCPGDANCDGQIDFGDINAFVAALVEGTYCDGTGATADVDQNGSVGFEDINPFVNLLTTNPVPIACP